MGYIIGYFFTPFIISFIIVHFVISRRYEKKNGEKYSRGKKVLYTILIGLGFMFVMLLGQ